jgi:ABC-type bacteriocin/lantibiotic exporter with double-glycine peptidase domain
MQSKKHSLRESLTNTFIGLVINYFALFGINWLLSIQSSPGKNTLIVLFFTIISIARGYIIRRWFNRKTTSSLSGRNEDNKTSSHSGRNEDNKTFSPFGEE